MSIEATIQKAISKLSDTYKVTPKEIRIKISKPDAYLEYEIMKNSDVIEKTNLANALNLSTIQAFLIGNRLEHIFQKICVTNKLPESTINVRIFTKTDDCSPSFYLFDGATAKRALTYKEISE